MAGERSGDSRSIQFGEASYLPEELPSDLLPSAARFALIARSLISDARYCRRAVMSLSEWRIFFEVLISSYLAAPSEDDERNLARLELAREQVESVAVVHRCQASNDLGEAQTLPLAQRVLGSEQRIEPARTQAARSGR